MKCTGSELGLHDCESKIDKESLKMCRKNSNGDYHVAGIMCQERAPDLITDVPYIVNTVHITETPVYQLVCAHEEGCLAKSADDEEWPYSYNARKLLRFSTRTWNRGMSAFLPDLQPDQWEWHVSRNDKFSKIVKNSIIDTFLIFLGMPSTLPLDVTFHRLRYFKFKRYKSSGWS